MPTIPYPVFFSLTRSALITVVILRNEGSSFLRVRSRYFAEILRSSG
jgi:hypothetical protein